MENKVSAYNLLDILESSVFKAKENIQHQYIENIKSYFNEDGSPKLISVNTDSKTIPIPTMCLTNLRPINIKSINIDFNCAIEGVENNDLMLNLSKDETMAHININIILNSEEPPEGVMRVNDILISEYIP